LAENSRVLALEHRIEATYDRQYNRALATLLKLREIPDAGLGSISAPNDPPPEFATATWDDHFQNEANPDDESKPEPICTE